MEDQRLAPCHISLYLGIFRRWYAMEFKNPIGIIREDLMRVSKLNAKATYHKALKDLHDFGYIEYIPTVSRYGQSQVRLIRFEFLKCIGLIGIKLIA
jgi:hypothetical protein